MFNNLQTKAVKILSDLKNNYSAVAVKADFEAEGTGLEELIFLSRIASMAGLNLTVKIGGCEAIFDLKQAKLFGASAIMVPVIESAFALKKFISAVERVFCKNYSFINLILNVETKTCVENLEQILKFGAKFLSSVVIGRVDLSSSFNLSRAEIDSDFIFDQCLRIFKIAKEFNLSIGLGGGVGATTYDRFLKRAVFDHYETRKIVFRIRGYNKDLFNRSINRATEFEVLCLEFKNKFFNQLAEEDVQRIGLLQRRLRELK